MADTGSELATDLAVRRHQGRDPHGELLLGVSNAVVRVYKKYFGKGPTQARAYYQDDLVACVLRDVYTRAERTLIDAGRSSVVLSARRELQRAVAGELTAAIEEITGREVIGFFSDSQEDPPMSIETFLLAPRAGT
jgi:uncharacterized protein YbcI